MSCRVRLLLLAGCGLIGLLEAPRAGSSLVAGLAGAYARQPSPAETLRAGARARATARAVAPTLLLFATGAVSGEPPLALGR